MAKRKRSAVAESTEPSMPPPPLPNAKSRRTSARKASDTVVQPTVYGDILDAPNALRASPDSDIDDKITPGNVKVEAESDSPLSDAPAEVDEIPAKAQQAKRTKAAPSNSKDAKEPKKTIKKEDDAYDPEAEDEEAADPDEIKEASLRPPPVNSSRLPLPFTGRLGYACLNTYLRFANPPVFCSRTTRIASILEHRHPLKNPDEPEHPTKNRPDKDQPADVARGQRFIENLCLQNVKDMKALIRWNDKFGIKFLRLSSEAFPFASHAEYGYRLAPFAAEALAEVGELAGKLGHRLTTHPGQFTQLGSPKQNVIDASIRDLEYHEEMLSLLKLPEQLDRDAIMILHLGGVFGDKAATLDRFRENYKKLDDRIKRRLVLENDDVSWSVHDLLPVCQELNIPFVLDYHHHNIIFDSDKIREGTHDIQDLYPQIIETWKRKGITPKMHYSEPEPGAITGRQRRKHSPRVATLPPLPDGVDLMIEAKDKEQSVLELMRNFKLPGWDTISDIIPYVRQDENRPVKTPKKKATPKKKRNADIDEDDDDAASLTSTAPEPVPDEDVNMGGPLGRVYWPPTMEEWLRPPKRVVKKKEPEGEGTVLKLTAAQKKVAVAQAKAELATEMKDKKKGSEAVNGSLKEDVVADGVVNGTLAKANGQVKASKSQSKPAKGKSRKKKEETPGSDEVAQEEEEAAADGASNRAKRSRSTRKPRKSYKEEDEVET